MTINFGVNPAQTSFTLSSDADFFQTLRTADSSAFVGTAVITLKFFDAVDTVLTTWTASIVGAVATFETDKADVATLLSAKPKEGRVYYEDGAGGPELLVAKGGVRDISP